MYTPNLHDSAQFNVADAREFVDFWSQSYNVSVAVFEVTEKESEGEDFGTAADLDNGQTANARSKKKNKKKKLATTIDYFAELNVGSDLTEENVRRLLRWKDSQWLTELKLNGEANGNVVRVLKSLSMINRFRNDQITEDDMRREADQVFPGGGVWKFFLLHIAKPAAYPIADGNVFQAFSLHKGLQTKKPYTWETYEAYRNYFGQIAGAMGLRETIENIRELKRIDNALMRFGQFLRAYCPNLALRPIATRGAGEELSASRCSSL